MDRLGEARRQARVAWRQGRRWFGPVLTEEEATSIGVEALFELQASEPDLPDSEVQRRIRTRVLNGLRDESRLQRRARGLDPEREPGVSGSGPESRLDGAALHAWLAEQLPRLPWNDRRLLEATLLASTGARQAALPARFGSRWTVRRALDRVLEGLRASARQRFGQPA